MSELLKWIEKDFGEVCHTAMETAEYEGDFIPTTLSMDIALYGGLKEGTITSLASAPKCGKTTWSLTVAANAQAMGKTVYYADAENRLENSLLDSIPGLDKSKLLIIRSSIDKVLSAEDYLNILERALKDDPGCLCIVDSVAAICPEAELGEAVRGNNRSQTPKIMYNFLRKIAPIMRPTRSSLILITHMQANTSGYGASKVQVGGNGIEFFASNWLVIKKVEKIDDPKTAKEIGKNSQFEVKAAACGAPNGEPTIYVRYGLGCDKYEDIIGLSQDLGFLNKAGAWFNFSEDLLKDEKGKPIKFQGGPAVREYLVKNPEFYKLLDSKIREIALPKKNG